MRNLFIDLLVWLVNRLPNPGLVTEEYHYNKLKKQRNSTDNFIEMVHLAEDRERRFKYKVLPVLAERGRRVFGNLKQSQPKTVQALGEYMPDHLILLDPAPGGRGLVIGRAYIVDTKLDLQCLHLALYGNSIGYEGWVEEPIVMYKGTPVLHARQAGEVKNG